MKKSSVFNRTFFRRPAVKTLVPDLKLLLTVLTMGCESHVGCWVPSGLGEDSGLERAALAGGLDDLEKKGLIKKDEASGEVFLCWWFRDNHFKGEGRGKQALGDFVLVQSPFLRAAILAAVAASPECGLSATFLEKHGLTS